MILKHKTPWLSAHGKSSDHSVSTRKVTGQIQRTTDQSAVFNNFTKLFSTMLCNRLSAVLDRHHSADQAGSRNTFRTTDHVMTYKTHIPEKQGVVNRHVGGSDRLQGGIRLYNTKLSGTPSENIRSVNSTSPSCKNYTLISVPPY